eukprot:194837-Alexandrium_andersonii.AAC.1
MGFQDPDLEFLPRASPTCSRRGRNLMLAWTAQHAWPLRKGDVKAAFAQGDATELDRHVLCEPVPEMAQALGLPADGSKVVRLRKAIYGLINAPLRWYEKFKAEIEKLGFVES